MKLSVCVLSVVVARGSVGVEAGPGLRMCVAAFSLSLSLSLSLSSVVYKGFSKNGAELSHDQIAIFCCCASAAVDPRALLSGLDQNQGGLNNSSGQDRDEANFWPSSLFACTGTHRDTERESEATKVLRHAIMCAWNWGAFQSVF